jgi:hypothetical protein
MNRFSLVVKDAGTRRKRKEQGTEDAFREAMHTVTLPDGARIDCDCAPGRKVSGAEARDDRRSGNRNVASDRPAAPESDCQTSPDKREGGARNHPEKWRAAARRSPERERQ